MTKKETLPVDELVLELQQEIEGIEAELKRVIAETPSGFSHTMLDLLERARSTGNRLAAAGNAQAEQRQVIQDFERLADTWVAARRREDAVAVLVNVALSLVAKAHIYEDQRRAETEAAESKLNSLVRGQKDDREFQTLLRRR